MTSPDRREALSVEEAIARGQAMLAASEVAADREITRLNARIVSLNAEVLDRMDQWHRDSLARDELARQQNAEIARLRAALAAEPAPLDVDRPEDARWVAALRDTTLYQCGHWLGGERICLLPNGHEWHTDKYAEPREEHYDPNIGGYRRTPSPARLAKDPTP